MKIVYVIALLVLLGNIAGAQPVPHLAYVYPAGGKAGTSFQITVGGQSLQTVSNAFITGPGITAVVLDRRRPMNQNDFNALRDRLKVLQDKFQATRKATAGTNVWTTADATEREQIRAKILKNPPNRTANPAMIDTVIIKVTVAADAAPGDREIRLTTPVALSNPLRFCIGTMPEITKAAAQPANPDLDKYLEKMGGKPAPVGTPKYEARVPLLPAVVNGQIMPGGVDRYRFRATRGQQLIIAASARQLIPYLADAVPGWFEVVLTIYDAAGKELASAERYRFQPDPVIHFEVPHDGEYTVELHDSIFRGREDFVYRLAVGELPFVTGIFPLGGRAGEPTPVALTGWNLPDQSVVCNQTETGLAVLTGNFINPVPFALDGLPECLENSSNHSVETAQTLTLPVVVNGHVSQPGEAEVFSFAGQAGQQIVAEVFARRLNSPLDSFLRLTDSAGKSLAFNDDYEDKGSGLNTHHADSYLTATLPATGTYFLRLTDTQGQGGPAFAYRLRLSEPQPDFALRVVPSSLSLRAGMSASLTLFAVRRDGFTNSIDLKLQDAPAGFSLSGARLAAGQDKAQFTLRAPASPLAQPIAIKIVGSAQIADQLITHHAVPAEDMMQAFIYRHLVPAQELAVIVSPAPRPFARDAFKLLGTLPVKLTPGGTAHVRVSQPPGNFADRFKLELDRPPEGITLTNVLITAGALELVLVCDAEKVKPGTTGNLICDVVPAKSQPVKKKGGNQPRAAAVATLPAIPFEVVKE